ncbi:unnamed protein product [Eruca vesicaria subsp. sativa]|uniref:Cysteine protease inhibitor WSCP-like n=1 Tax=Eruca vesicaria subsp. sativa TaxID=29727 RepID=A0ABC8KPZ4_ERUVS|nr:unnamed protein product [Eruca vesicaria subsp. sativa]
MKKPSVTSLLITLLLSAAICAHGTTNSNGDPVKVGEKYFMQPVKTENNNGGGLVPAPTNILPFCPLGITQTLLPYQPGLPVTFRYTENIDRDYITTNTPINIEFRSDIWPVCNEFSKLWAVDDSSSAIIIGGKEKSPKSEFKIQNVTVEEHTYKLTTSYGTVGTIPGAWGGAPQLLVTNDESKTLVVKFVKVDDDATKSKATTTTTTSLVEKLGLWMFPFY